MLSYYLLYCLVSTTMFTGERVDAGYEHMFALQWRRPVVRTGMFRTVRESFGRAAIAAGSNHVIVGTGEGYVLAFDLQHGNEVWRYKHGIAFETAASIINLPNQAEVALLASRDGTLLAFDSQHGGLIWQTHIDGDMRAAPCLQHETLLVTTSTNRLIAIDSNTGNIRWSQGRKPPTSLTIEGHAACVVDNNMVYTSFSDGYVVAVALATGDLVWSRPLSLKKNDFTDADADPCIIDHTLFVASYTDGIYALDPVHGHIRWHKMLPAITTLHAADGLLVAGSADGVVMGLQPADGNIRYRTMVGRGAVSRIETQDHVLALTSADNGFVILNAKTGKPLQAATVGSRLGKDITWVGHDMAFLSSSGYLYVWTKKQNV